MEGVVADSSERTNMRHDCEDPVGENLANGHNVNGVEQETVSLKAHSVMGHTCANGNPWKISTTVLSVVLVISITLIILLLGKLCQVPAVPRPPDAMPPSPCPQRWVGDGSRSYYFSGAEETWNASQNNCSSQGGSLVTMETEKEKKFVRSSQHRNYYWLGLWRKEGKSWQRADGSLFNNTFPIAGDGPCAYMSEGEPRSTWCESKRYWICTRRIHDP